MTKMSLAHAIPQTHRLPIIRLDRIASLLVGFLLISVSPYAHGFFRDWRVSITDNWGIYVFDVFIPPLIYFGLIYYGFRDGFWIRKHERFLFVSLILIIFSRLVSVLFAGTLDPDMVSPFSIFRYIETLILIYIFANIFTDSRNRALFVLGVIMAVIIETIGGFYMLFAIRKGFFVSTTSFILQTFLVLVLVFLFLKKRHRLLIALLVLVLVLAIFATLARTALLFLLVVCLLGLLFSGRKIIRPFLFFSILVVITSLFVATALPVQTAIFMERVEMALRGEGSIAYRLHFWDKGLATFLEHPFVGIGSGGFGRQLEHLPQKFQPLDPAEASILEASGKFGTHNKIVEIISETGTVGVIAYIFWAAAVIGLALRVLRLANKREDGYAISAAFIVIGFIIADFYTNLSFTPMSNAFVGFLLGWYRGEMDKC